MKPKTVCSLLLLIPMLSCNLVQQKKESKETGSAAGEEIRIVREYFDNGRIRSEIEAKGSLRHGITKNYSKNGRLLSEVNYVNNKKDGLSVNYYPSGKIHTKLMYRNGVKDGESIWYYESGKVFRINPFKNGKIDGIQKFYFENGTPMAEVPYRNGQPGLGLKEYSESGTLLNNYPDIRFEEVDQVYSHQTFILKIFLSNKSTKVRFYIDDLLDGKYLDEKAVSIPLKEGVATKEYRVIPGSVKKDRINVIAVYTTRYGLPYLTRRTYNLVIQ
ncbi:MAG: toxin-antitoxin system YwqK family antitoxin [Bacteroidales bacterium]|nr:toxin-antitoxin system YwqK family antitoxin [Bacteroidales bacterium]